jgi:RNA polymerase sigma-70 factor (ECF subfamily)
LQQTDNSIIEGCKSNSKSAQEKLYRLWYRYGMSICLPYTNSEEEAMEVVNDGFIKVFKNIIVFDENKKFKVWFRRILVNSAIDHFRKNKNHYNHLDTEDISITDFNDNVIDTLSVEEIMSLVQNLPPAYKMVFNLYALDGFKHHEIANMLNISIGTSKSNLAKARNKLKVAIDTLNSN